MDYLFDIDEWLPRFPAPARSDDGDARIITSPCHLCNNHRLRPLLADQVDWGPAVPVDIFVMADGEPPDPCSTKIGGLPYRPTGKPWPTTANGAPLRFLAQFCFEYSKDLTGPLPDDVLLVFGDEDESHWVV